MPSTSYIAIGKIFWHSTVRQQNIWRGIRTKFNTLAIEEISIQLKVTGHTFWRFAENRYCTLNIFNMFKDQMFASACKIWY
jgi:hypothetical protein